jgi:molybdenum cofactor cytidylyltransferase
MPGQKPGRPKIGAVVLAAGRSTRMGARHKLLEPVGGRALLSWAVEAALKSDADPVVVVLGHRPDDVSAVLPAEVITVNNPDFAGGLSTSLAVGIGALPEGTSGAAVLLGDMPGVGPELVNRLIAAWLPGKICVPMHGGQRGNPVLWDACFFPEIQTLSGDRGARGLLLGQSHAIIEVPADASVLRDVDTPQDLDRARRGD